MRNFFLLVIGFLFFTGSHAQLLNGIGLSVGGSNYSGDIGDEIFILPNRVGGSFLYKRNVSSRISLRTSLGVFPIADRDSNSSNIVRQRRNLSFSNTLYEVSMGVEFNYFDYDITSSYDVATPYIHFGFAGFYYNVVTSIIGGNYNYSGKVAYSIPFGLGYKSKITRNFGYALEVKAAYTFEDDLDYNNNKISVLRFGNLNTNDWYFFTGVSLIYSFGRPKCAVSPHY